MKFTAMIASALSYLLVVLSLGEYCVGKVIKCTYHKIMNAFQRPLAQ